jgi:hypothetical protein
MFSYNALAVPEDVMLMDAPSLTGSSTLAYCLPPSPPAFVRQVTLEHRQQQRRTRKERSTSSLPGMFVDESSTTTTRTTPPQEEDVAVMEEDHPMEMEAEPTTLPPPPTFERQVTSEEEQQQEQQQQQQPFYSKDDRQQLVEMTRKLRQTKRRLFLKSAIEPSCSVDRFRSILLRAVSQDEQSLKFDYYGSSSSLSSPLSLLSLRGRQYQQQQQQQQVQQQRQQERHDDHLFFSSSSSNIAGSCDDAVREENMNEVG